MARKKRALEDMIMRGEIELVEVDEAIARNEIEQARRHLATARTLIGVDNNVAHTALYDGARKAINAHMRFSGYRAKGPLGRHATTVRYARAVFAGRGFDDALEAFDEMRQVR